VQILKREKKAVEDQLNNTATPQAEEINTPA
jgi:hypothetical protein